MSALLTLSQAAALLGCRDPRTARKRLAALGVPVLELAGRVLVDEAEARRAIRAHARPLEGSTPARAAGVILRPGARLWDGAPEISVAPRRANARGRGGRAGARTRSQPTKASAPAPPARPYETEETT